MDLFSNIYFANPAFLYLLVIVPLMVTWYVYKHKSSHPDLQFSDTKVFINAPKTARQKFFHGLFVLRMLAIALLIVALARPQTKSSNSDVNVEGIDIVLAMDISGSMLAEDLKPNRLEASKKVAMDFIDGRPNDRIGLVIFSSESFTQCPLTTDHTKLKNLFSDIKSGMIEDGTAIGDGLATAVNRLSKSTAVSKVVILLTDGINNAGSIDPLTAAEIAKLYNVRVYTIGVGTMGMAPYPFQTVFGIQYQNAEVKIDEPMLKEIAQTDNGKYYRATSNKKLEEIYKEIDKLEKSKMEVLEYKYRTDIYFPFALAALILFAFELFSKYIFYRSIP
jgi:Ca-activated chloride channel homolog